MEKQLSLNIIEKLEHHCIHQRLLPIQKLFISEQFSSDNINNKVYFKK